jgi:hypothetical protein
MKNLLYFLLSGMFAAALLLGSCQKVVYPPIEVPTDVSYSADIQPIWDAKCVSCHGGGISPDLRPDVSYAELVNGGYVDTGNPEESSLMQKLYSGSHDARASEEEKQTILAWITEGALNN